MDTLQAVIASVTQSTHMHETKLGWSGGLLTLVMQTQDTCY